MLILYVLVDAGIMTDSHASLLMLVRNLFATFHNIIGYKI